MLVASPVKRAIDHHTGGPVTLVGHIRTVDLCSNPGYANPSVTGLVYITAFAKLGFLMFLLFWLEHWKCR